MTEPTGKLVDLVATLDSMGPRLVELADALHAVPELRVQAASVAKAILERTSADGRRTSCPPGVDRLDILFTGRPTSRDIKDIETQALPR